jgi:hypothetical protein
MIAKPTESSNSSRPPAARIWHGIVQDRNDPLQCGRIRVRVIGLHTDDEYPTPVENLPWAQMIVPANASTTFSTPKEGEWVALYFADEGTYTVPIVMGVIPGIVSRKETDATRNAPTETQVTKLKTDLDAAKAKLAQMKASFNANTKIQDLQKKAQSLGNAYTGAVKSGDQNAIAIYLARYEAAANELKVAEEDAKRNGVPTANDIAKQEQLVTKLTTDYNVAKKKYEERPNNQLGDPRSQAQKDKAPQNPGYSSNRAAGKPTVPLISRMTTPKGVRELKGTIIEEMNKLREHACDWTIPFRKELADLRSRIALWIQAIRAAIDAAIAFLFGTPFMQTLKKAVAWIKAKIRLIKKIARIIQEKIAYYLDYIRAVLELIEFILTLPAQLLQLFQKCLTELLGDFGKTIKLAVQLVTDPLGYTLKQIGAEFSKIDADPETPEETKLLADLDSALTVGDKPAPEMA